MKLGKKALEALQAEIDGRLMLGDELIVAGPVAGEGNGPHFELHGSQRIIMTGCGSFLQNGFSRMP